MTTTTASGIDLIPGDRIELVAMPDAPDPIPVGERGIVQRVVPCFGNHQIGVEWESGRTLSLVIPPDEYRVIERVID